MTAEEVRGQISKCHCGWTGDGNHLCHRCGKVPGKDRFYSPGLPFSLAGAQPKFSVCKTFGCDACWIEFTNPRKELL